MDNYISDLKNQVNHISNKQILIQLLGQTKYDIEKYKRDANYSNYIHQIYDIFEDKIDKNKIMAVLDIKNLEPTKMTQLPLNVMNELSLKLDTQLQFKEDTKIQAKQSTPVQFKEDTKIQAKQSTPVQFKEDTKIYTKQKAPVQFKQNENAKLQLQQIQEERKRKFYELKEKERQKQLELKQKQELRKKQEEERKRIELEKKEQARIKMEQERLKAIQERKNKYYRDTRASHEFSNEPPQTVHNQITPNSDNDNLVSRAIIPSGDNNYSNYIVKEVYVIDYDFPVWKKYSYVTIGIREKFSNSPLTLEELVEQAQQLIKLTTEQHLGPDTTYSIINERNDYGRPDIEYANKKTKEETQRIGKNRLTRKLETTIKEGYTSLKSGYQDDKNLVDEIFDKYLQEYHDKYGVPQIYNSKNNFSAFGSMYF
jgi:hypothetical protein